MKKIKDKKWSNKLSDWYPQIELSIRSSQKGRACKIKADFDTGAMGLFVSDDLVEIESFSIPQMDQHLGQKFVYFIQKMHLQLSGTEKQISTNVYVIKDFKNSPFTLLNKDRNALVGRNILSQFGAVVELDWEHHKSTVRTTNWRDFEVQVANLYRKLPNSTVYRNVNLNGNQIDVVLEETLSSGRIVKSIIECKYYRNPVGVKEVRDFANLITFFRDAELASHGILVSSNGFTKDAFQVASSAKLDLIEYSDLEAKVKSLGYSQKGTEKIAPQESHRVVVAPVKKIIFAGRTAFIAMPFSDEYRDIYLLGIREVLQNNNIAGIRVDELEYSGRVMDKVEDLIRSADIIIAEVTERNPNVYYELGLAQANNKPLILCTRNINSAPFDTRDLLHIVYKDIIDLRKRLDARLQSLIMLSK